MKCIQPAQQTRRERRARWAPRKRQALKREGPTWDVVTAMRLWNGGLFGPLATFNFTRLILALGRPMLGIRFTRR